ncbi:regulator of microtubule dynamics protein 3 isoform X3 [Ovis aries]|uniref:regulator of microtubule dynamics protein 3 isoform X3 n=1 Tax=Ovis aries TaxID=9940 RepID=UPI00295272F7|nr:regulator of microtubule dynamics protein 3 isoform X3 [Ovis aries]
MGPGAALTAVEAEYGWEPATNVRLLRAVPGEAGDAAVLPSLPRGQEVVLDRLEFVLTSLVALRREVEELRSSLQGLAGQIVGEVRSLLFRSHMEENQKVARRRRFPFARERSDSTGSSSVYFTAASGATFTDAESEGGYTTANAESDYERDSERESDGEDEVSCETVKMGRKDSLDLEVEVALGPEPEALEAGGSPSQEDVLPLLQQADELHQGSEQGKREGFQLLLNNKLAHGSRQDFLWRLARAYSDMCELAEEASEKRSYALSGKEEAEVALEKGNENAECHQWYAVLCGQLAEHEGIQRRIQSGFSFKEHVDKAIALKPENPMAHFLLGRWCYQVSHLSWLEKKTATALSESPLGATVQDALSSFLKAEELQPGFSKAGRIYICKVNSSASFNIDEIYACCHFFLKAYTHSLLVFWWYFSEVFTVVSSQCYKELGKNPEAKQWMKLALELPNVTKEDSAFQKDLEELEVILAE